MSALKNPDGDVPRWRRVAFEAKAVVKRRLAPSGTAVTAPKSPYLVVPILGQSNAFGMGVGLDRDGEDRPDRRVHQFAMSGPSKATVILAEEPLRHEIPGYGVGFGLTFGKLLADATGRHVLLIPGARGDTAFAPKNGYTWDPGDSLTRVNLYVNAVNAIDAALNRSPGSTVAAVLWHQGESDVPLTSGALYREKLDFVIDDLRRRYGNDVPFLLGQMVPEEMELSRKDYSVIDAIHADTPNRRHRTQFVTGERDCINGGLDRHYNAIGQRAMGRAMWARYREMCPDDLAEYASE
ncbi:acetylxylan esterase [Mycobacterium antarcticum]|uniref:sialate O-acetylesterase n=1 Tax=unclassified Mycolicibacterium TaxID=2636767 RepID=UPI0023880751|nr:MULTISPECIES: sialate O-acetylesterase [unclassified Mycolicibacterium]GLP77047.1 acetylxylan esterase [Mycolicibacterium sp. TUM20983]GLP82531.1 acetylxylan esterase [Mycolicibacterium sp. TUM20984]